MQKNKYVLFVFAFVLVFFTFTFSIIAATPTKGDAIVTLSVDKDSFAQNEKVMVKVTITNSTKRSIKVLKWYTPVDGVEEPLFKVARDGQFVEYIGAHYKRPQPEDADYISLKSGESITHSVDLAEFYDLSVTGSYKVNYDVASLNLFQKGNGLIKQIGNIKSNEITIWIEGRTAQPPTETTAPMAITTGSNSYAKCTISQQSDISTARNDAAFYSSNALNYLNGTAGPRYTTWFGVYDGNRYNIVRNNFANILNAMNTASMTFDCGCKKRYYAYVYANQPYTIYICSTFWTAPSTGTDSKAGTLVHETSHFTIVAGTEDWAYGQTNAKNLATTDPNKAIDNADSHEYFAENTPAQQ